MTQSSIQLIGHYYVNDNPDVSLIELIIDRKADEIDLLEFTQEIDNEPRSNWQAPFDEKYLDPDGNTIIGDDLVLPTHLSSNTRMTFYMYFLDESKSLLTPFGRLQLPKKISQPSRIKDLLNFEDPEY